MKIKLFVMDIDGTMTDGRLYIGAEGEVMKAFDVKDGYAIAHILPEYGIIPVIITGRTSAIAEERAKELHITELYQRVHDKLVKLKELAGKYGVEPENIAYIGDDLNDVECLRYAGISAAPADAAEAAKQAADRVCSHSGGRGAVREFIDMIVGELSE